MRISPLFKKNEAIHLNKSACEEAFLQKQDFILAKAKRITAASTVG